MKRMLFLGIAVALCGAVASPPIAAKEMGTPVFIAKKVQVYQSPAPVLIELSTYNVCDLAATDFLLIAPTQAALWAVAMSLKVNAPVMAVKATGGLPRSPGNYAYGDLYRNRFGNSRCHANRICHIDPGLRGC